MKHNYPCNKQIEGKRNKMKVSVRVCKGEREITRIRIKGNNLQVLQSVEYVLIF